MKKLPIVDSWGGFWGLPWPLECAVLFKRTIRAVFMKHRLSCCVSSAVSTHICTVFASNTVHPTCRRHFPLHAATYFHFTTVNCYLCVMWVKSEYEGVASVSFVLVIPLKVSQEWLICSDFCVKDPHHRVSPWPRLAACLWPFQG